MNQQLNIESQENSPLIKLGNIHRRVYPLSLFPTPEPTPMNLFTMPLFSETENSKSKPTHKKAVSINNSIIHKTERKIIIPALRYKEYENRNHSENLEHRCYYKPNHLQLSPRSKVTIYTLKPIHTNNPSPIQTSKKKQKKQKNVENVVNEPQPTTIKISRVTSSKILFPALTVGQIIMRVKELVLDPLKKELINYKIR